MFVWKSTEIVYNLVVSSLSLSLPSEQIQPQNVMLSFCLLFSTSNTKAYNIPSKHVFFFFFSLSFVSFQVSWVRRKGDELNLITFGRHTYSSDSRYSLEYVAPNDWQLLIQYANERDEGTYECQIATHPPLVLLVYLTVVGTYESENSYSNSSFSTSKRIFNGKNNYFQVEKT